MRALGLACLAVLLLAGCTRPVEQQSTDPNATQDAPPVVTEQPLASPSPSPPTGQVAAPATPTPAPTPPSPSSPPAPMPTATPTVAPSPTPTPAPTPSPTSAPPTPPSPSPAPAPSWPREGSYVRYAFEGGESVPGYSNVSNGVATWTWHDGDWHGVCDADYAQENAGTPTVHGHVHRVFSAANPPHWPLFDATPPPAPGMPIHAWELYWDCTLRDESGVYRGAHDYEGSLNGREQTVPSYWANATDPEEMNYRSLHTEWARANGLVLQWSDARQNSGASGSLTATDAPLGEKTL